MSSSLKDFGDSFARFQRRDDELGAEIDRDMEDPVWAAHARNEYDSWEYEEPPVGNLIDFDESCIAGRGDLLHLVEKMIARKP